MTYSVLGIDTQTGEQIVISQSARRQGLYIIGSTGQGKSGLIENLIVQDIKQGVGVCLLDPHGDLTRNLLARIPQERIDNHDVIYLDIAEEDYPFGLNFFTCDNPKSAKAVQKVVDQVIHIFEKLFEITRTTPLLIQYLRNCTHTLVVNPGYAMADIPVLLRNKDCRRKLVANVIDPNVLGFWQNYEEMSPRDQREEREPILRRLEEFLQPLTRNIVGQAYSTIDLRTVMDERKILLVTLDPLLESVTSLIGSVLVALFLNAAYSRSDIEDVRKRKQFNLYADEFQRFATEDFATLLTEARKFGIATTIAHQARFQPGMTEAIRATSLQAANLVMFRITSQDAQELAGNFDSTPIRTKKVLKQRTEPKYKEWDEYYWDSEEAEQQFHELDQPLQDAWQQKLQAIIRAMCAQALSEHFRDAFSSKKWHHTPDYDGESLNTLISLSNKDEGWYKDHKTEITYYLHHPLNPAWMPFQGNGKAPLAYTEEVERNLVLRDLRSETVRDHFYYWPDWWNGKPFYKKYRKRVDYSYLKREEWYSFSGEAAISGVEYALQHGSWPSVITSEFPFWKNTSYTNLISMKQEVDALFRSLLKALITEVHEFVAPFYAGLRLKFVPHLAPEMPWDRAKRDDPYCRDGWSPPEDGEVQYPHLANEPQPEIGQRRVGIGWTREGHWSTWKFEGAESWLIKMEKRLEEQVKRSEQEVVDCENKRLQLLEQQKEIKNHHYKTIHRREYLGEQPVKEQQYKGEYPRITDVQWYDYQEELDQTPAQRRDEIENELSNLPKFTARVKIATEEKLVEHTVRTLEPERGVGRVALQERIRRIQSDNRDHGYCQKREDIEEAIVRRQAQCSQQPDEPPISRHPPR